MPRLGVGYDMAAPSRGRTCVVPKERSIESGLARDTNVRGPTEMGYIGWEGRSPATSDPEKFSQDSVPTSPHLWDGEDPTSNLG